jgi:hypothetical protein
MIDAPGSLWIGKVIHAETVHQANNNQNMDLKVIHAETVHRHYAETVHLSCISEAFIKNPIVSDHSQWITSANPSTAS